MSKDIKKAKKLLTFAQDKDLAMFDELQETNDKLEEVVEAVKSIPKTDIPEFPSIPTEMKVKLEGVEVITLKGDKGDPGNDADEEKIIQEVFRKIQIPEDGKDGRNPLTVSQTPPKNPQKGDLWYQD